MAFVRQGVTKLTFNWTDGKDKASSSIHVGNVAGSVASPNESEFESYLLALVADMEAISHATLESVTYSIQWINNAPAIPGVEADVERKAVFVWRTAGGFNSLFTVPGAKGEIFNEEDGVIRDNAVAGSFTGNPQQTALESMYSKIIDGPTINLQTHMVTDRRDDDISSMRDAYKQHRSNPRG